MFSSSLWNSVEYVWKQLCNPRFVMVYGQTILGGQPYPKLWQKYKTPYAKFHRFCYKNILKINFFHKFLIFICYFHTLFADFIISSFILNWNSQKTNIENFSVFQKNFNFQNLQFLSFHVINWLNFDLELKFVHQNIPIKVIHDENRSHLKDISKDIRGVKMAPLGCLQRSKWLVLQ